ncbi:ABC transporter ATP-binding protein [Zobellia galactanivorans]|uniref:Lipid A export ATP-binding/permease protein n=1 Tax=Zobellia galactanivorans (strain DSM 12802 / CCUG 47099 / CIP 106680 / NCIMB 13871 / Dsij) TaxID=63186 RepID=G0L069_ZOBGA|nr:ABC transporter ATP-binding protein [Zobellia galactanivorans]MBU3027186.1 ABC transporter ATP-binding protein/permease [Zobellia galactanivorans]CAZ94159.1 Lipid A export ATP-binding/permease protein [Zobellia galactanivorans]
MEYFKKILRFAKPYSKYGYLNIFFNILYALFSALSFAALIPMLDVLFKPENRVLQEPVYTGMGSLKDYLQAYINFRVNEYSGDDEMKGLILVIGLVLVLFLLKNFFNYLAMYFITFLRNGVLKDIRNKMYKKIVELPISFYSEKRKGDVIARITSDVLEIQHSFLSVLELIVREPLTILFTIIIMFGISTKLTIFVFVFIPIAGTIISRIGKSLKKKSDRVQKEQGEFLSIVEETLGGLRVIKAFNSESYFSRVFEKSTNRFFRFSNSLLNRQNLASPTGEFLGILVIGVLLWFGGKMVLVDKTLDPSSFIAYMGLAYNILTPAKAISKASYGVKKGNAAAERVLEILETENPIVDKIDAVNKPSFDSGITLEDISFKYEDEYVLKNFNLSVPKGDTVALVGQSGSGKSTIANLITRFYDVNEGSILIDGHNIKDISKKSLRGLMGLVTQDSILFNDTVAHNIALGKENATQEEIIEAAKIANAHEFIVELPNGYDTNIGDSGNKLSGGQKQRLSIARAVLKNPPIMILDEATSALDTESERLVQDALEKMMRNRTSIVIAHRLSTIQNANTIVVLQKGVIVEQGSHDELLAKNGTYKKLVQMQSLG